MEKLIEQTHHKAKMDRIEQREPQQSNGDTTDLSSEGHHTDHTDLSANIVMESSTEQSSMTHDGQGQTGTAELNLSPSSSPSINHQHDAEDEEEYNEMMDTITSLKDEIRKPLEFKPILDFEDAVSKEVVFIDEIGLEEVTQSEESIKKIYELEAKKRKNEVTEDKNLLSRRSKIWREERREDFASEYRRLHKWSSGKNSEWNTKQQIAFAKVFNRLSAALDMREEQMITQYGKLQISKAVASYFKSDAVNDNLVSIRKSSSLSWLLPSAAPRVLCLSIEFLRALKNKVPAGEYAMVVTLCDRIGGQPLHQSRVPLLHGTSENPAAADMQFATYSNFTQYPQRHGGKFYSTELRFNQPENFLFIRIPSKGGQRFSHCLLFELIALQSWKFKHDVVYAHGYFPLYLATQDVLNGKYKLPLVRGPMNPMIDKFHKFEAQYQQDIDNWLCNCYFSVTEKPVILSNNEWHVDNTLEVDLKSELHSKNFRDQQIKEEMETKLKMKQDVVTLPSILDATALPSSNSINDASSTSKDKETEVELERKAHWREHFRYLRNFHYSVTNVYRDVPRSPLQEKLHFFWNAIIDEFHLGKFLSFEFWSLIFFLSLAFFLRMYIHYFGQYMFLQNSMHITVYTYELLPYTCKLHYNVDPNLELYVRTFMLMIGPLSNCIFFTILCAIGKIPAMSHHYFQLAFSVGIMTVLDPFWIAVVDLATQNWNGDYFAPYRILQSQEGLGYLGALLATLLAIVLTIIALLIILFYLLHIHYFGRMFDLFYRVHSDETMFFVPHDFEISLRVFQNVLQKARQFKGMRGTRRQILVLKYHLESSKQHDATQNIVHFSIFTVNPSSNSYSYAELKPGDIDLYRHFLRLENGTLLECMEGSEVEMKEYIQEAEKVISSQSFTSASAEMVDFDDKDAILAHATIAIDSVSVQAETKDIPTDPKSPQTESKTIPQVDNEESQKIETVISRDNKIDIHPIPMIDEEANSNDENLQQETEQQGIHEDSRNVLVPETMEMNKENISNDLDHANSNLALEEGQNPNLEPPRSHESEENLPQPNVPQQDSLESEPLIPNVETIADDNSSKASDAAPTSNHDGNVESIDPTNDNLYNV